MNPDPRYSGNPAVYRTSTDPNSMISAVHGLPVTSTYAPIQPSPRTTTSFYQNPLPTAAPMYIQQQPVPVQVPVSTMVTTNPVVAPPPVTFTTVRDSTPVATGPLYNTSSVVYPAQANVGVAPVNTINPPVTIAPVATSQYWERPADRARFRSSGEGQKSHTMGCPNWLWYVLAGLAILGLITGLILAFVGKKDPALSNVSNVSSASPKGNKSGSGSTSGSDSASSGSKSGSGSGSTSGSVSKSGSGTGSTSGSGSKSGSGSTSGSGSKSGSDLSASGSTSGSKLGPGSTSSSDSGNSSSFSGGAATTTQSTTTLKCNTDGGYFLNDGKCIRCPAGSNWNGTSCIKKTLVPLSQAQNKTVTTTHAYYNPDELHELIGKGHHADEGTTGDEGYKTPERSWTDAGSSDSAHRVTAAYRHLRNIGY